MHRTELYFVGREELGLDSTGGLWWRVAGDSQRWTDGKAHGLNYERAMLSWKQRLEHDEVGESGKTNPSLAVRLVILLFL